MKKNRYRIPVRIVPPNIDILLGRASARTVWEEVEACSKKEACRIAGEKHGIKILPEYVEGPGD